MIYITKDEKKVIRRIMRRNLVKNLRPAERRLREINENLCHIYKGVEMAAAGAIVFAMAVSAIVFAIAVSAADSIPNKWICPYMAVLVISMLVMIGGIKLLGWMRR